MVRAAIVRAPGTTFEIDEIELGPVGPGRVRVRIAASGVCRSDRSVQDGTIPQPFPVVLGHEGSGVVVEVGPDVNSPAVGDHVVLSWIDACRQCPACRRGQVELCERGIDHAFAGTYATASDGTALWAGFGTATFAEETIVPAACAIPIDPSFPLELAALVGCGVVTGAGAVRNSARVTTGESVAVIGVGGVGLSAVQAAIDVGARPVIAVDRLIDKLRLAVDCGATHTIDGTQVDPVIGVRELTSGAGVDHAIEVVGLPVTIRQAYDMTRRGGTVTIVGAGKFDDIVQFGAMQLMVDAKTIRGCVYGATDPARDIPKTVELHQRGRIDLERLVSRRIALDDLDEAMMVLDTGAAARSVIVF
jgi:S-(hydroxymethyl)glutathione dehydrogenase / alcohol dehydrogenase